MLEFALVEGFDSSVQFGASSEPVWFEALPARIYQTPMYGEVPVTLSRLEKFVKNFHDNVRGQEIAIDYEHGTDAAKGKKAAGWFKDIAIKPSSSDPSQMSLYVAAQFTEEAQQEIKSGAWKYFSAEWEDLWQANDGTKHEDVITGGALTNRPVAKNMAALPVNFSEAQWNELDEETQKQFAVWTTKYVNSLPNSSFLYIESEAEKGPDGETKKENRHLPYKDASGKIDLPHLRNAIARIPQMKGISDALKAKLQAKARSILAAQSKSMSEEVVSAIESGTLVLVDEVREWEHSEPGTGPAPALGDPEQPDPGTGQPVPRITGDPADDPAIGGGWRRIDLPLDPSDPAAPKAENRDNGGSALTPEELAELRAKLGLAEDSPVADIIATAGTAFSESVKLRDAVALAGQEKEFAEKYPKIWAEQQRLMAESRETKAKEFSESVATVTKTEGETQVNTNTGLSALALDKVRETHKKFSEGTATLDDFEEVVKTIVQGGIVKFGEDGSRTPKDPPPVIDVSSATGVRNARKAFAEKVAEIQKADELELGPAMTLAAERYPELAEAYRATAAA